MVPESGGHEVCRVAPIQIFENGMRDTVVRGQGCVAHSANHLAGSPPICLVWIACVVIGSGVAACTRERRVATETPLLPSQAVAQTSASCRECHGDIVAAWAGTDHARANQPVEDADLAGAFDPPRAEEDGGSRFRVGRSEKGHPQMIAGDPSAGSATHPVEAVLGWKPSRQVLVPAEGGRWQAVDLAWDPARQEWFNVFGNERRHAGEWGHWTGRGMNWNSMCAHCHMTGYRKHYDAATDRYRSTWVEHGVGCIQCHGPVSATHGRRSANESKDSSGSRLAWIRDPQRAMERCAYCHARNEPLTAELPPGANYHDHFRLTLPVDPAMFWPDGQQRDEVFNWTSVMLSRMRHAGVTCTDCHDPHTTKPMLPVRNNALCLQCHSAPGQVMPDTGIEAPAIDPTAHSHHAADSTGNQCVTCHMPTTSYMVRSPRHDHGWLKPDPLLTKELGIPNACNRCHTDESVDWAIAHVTKWYGDRLESRQRARARAVAAVQAGDASAEQALLRLLASEDIAAWRATYLQLLAGRPDAPAVVSAARAALRDADPLVRASAVQVLTGESSTAAALGPSLRDPARLVRLDAAWAQAATLPAGSAVERELLDYLDLLLDQPSGRLRRGQFLANTSRLEEAEAEMRLAATWDRYSAGIHESHGRVLQALGRAGDAADAWSRAAELEPDNGELMLRAGLAYAEANRLPEAEMALRAAVERQPALHRGWYNLGLLLAQTSRRDEALETLAEAERRAPAVPEYPYAAATIHWQLGDRDRAVAAARRALAADSGFAPARTLLQQR
ncbi:MAG: hypothetical protein GEV06_14330 [Luteitalea sp.]|nr:hypothetical protein [Luteitalea sp.]